MVQKKELTGIGCMVICQFLFGFSFLFTKNITQRIAPINLLSWRFLLAFGVLCLLTGLKVFKLRFKGKPLKPLLLMALFHPVCYFVGETVGVKLTTASESGTLIACIPIVTMLCSSLVTREKPRRLQAAGILVTTLGVMVTLLVKGFEPSFQPIGYLMLLVAVVSYSLYAVLAHRATAYTDAEKTFVMLASGAVTFTLAALVQNGFDGSLTDYLLLPFTDTGFLVTILYLSLGSTVIAFFLNNVALTRIGSTRSASFAGLSTLVTIISGVWILHEEFSAWQVLGAALVLGGVYLANKPAVERA